MIVGGCIRINKVLDVASHKQELASVLFGSFTHTADRSRLRITSLERISTYMGSRKHRKC